MSRQRRAYILAIISCLLWSTMATAFSLALREMDGLQIMLWASLVAVVCLLLVLTATRQLSQLAMVRMHDLWKCALLGFLNPFLYYAVLMKAYTILPAQEAMALNYTWPVMLVLFSIPVLGQKIGWRSIVALMISFVGVLVIGTQGRLDQLRLSNPLGDALALGSSVIWGLYWVYSVRFSNKRPTSDAPPESARQGDEGLGDITRVLISILFGSVYLLVATLIFSDLRVPTIRGLMSITYIGLFELGITFVIWLKALKLSTTTDRVSQFVFFSPFFALVWIRIILKEEIMPATLIGLGLVVGGAFIQQKFARSMK